MNMVYDQVTKEFRLRLAHEAQAAAQPAAAPQATALDYYQRHQTHHRHKAQRRPARHRHKVRRQRLLQSLIFWSAFLGVASLLAFMIYVVGTRLKPTIATTQNFVPPDVSQRPAERRAPAADGAGGNPQTLLAALMTGHDDPAADRRVYEDRLIAEPEQPDALLGLLRTHLRAGDLVAARGAMARLKTAGIAAERWTLEAALLAAFEGRDAEGRALLARIPAQTADAIPAILRVYFARQGAPATERAAALDALGEFAQQAPDAGLALARFAIEDGEFGVARARLDQVLQLDPQYTTALGLLLELDCVERQPARAEQYATRLLALDPHHELANMVLSSRYLREGDYARAEAALRIAVAAERHPSVLNNLAWALLRQGRADEALPLAQEAVLRDPQLALAWDTLAAIRIARSAWDEAAAATTRAVALAPDNPSILLHQAQVEAQFGRREAAAEILARVAARASTLDTASRAAYRDLRAQLSH
ncbi:MAG: tetratricopeptide repeat protein [Kiritimatiellaeota bacterium]|nr:tetratricopeptide repeat protein [Kiritimatiellota bacterium]